LFGDARGDGRRRSPLDHYHGRSLLVAWLRAVIAQREAEAWRAEYRAHPDGKIDAAVAFADPAPSEPEDPDRGRYLAMVACELHKTIDALASRDRLRLSYYYVQELTLAETGALLGEHESTVSRGLARTRVEIRRNLEGGLRKDYRLSDDQIGRCFEYVLGDWPFDLARALEPAK
jgi:RNA polymerase sigma factor (sigma-70 family)